VGQQFTVISTDGTEAKLRDFCGQVVLMPVGRLQLVEGHHVPNDAGPGQPGLDDDHERKVQEAIGAFMAERAEAFIEFTDGAFSRT
jgi:hypothetical protein